MNMEGSTEISSHRLKENEKMEANICLFNLSTNFYCSSLIRDTKQIEQESQGERKTLIPASSFTHDDRKFLY